MEGTCNGKFGFVLCVMQSTDVGKGLIREGVGSATFNVKYTCVAFLPHKGEVLDTIVTSVNKVDAASTMHSHSLPWFCVLAGAAPGCCSELW